MSIEISPRAPGQDKPNNNSHESRFNKTAFIAALSAMGATAIAAFLLHNGMSGDHQPKDRPIFPDTPIATASATPGVSEQPIIKTPEITATDAPITIENFPYIRDGKTYNQTELIDEISLHESESLRATDMGERTINELNNLITSVTGDEWEKYHDTKTPLNPGDGNWGIGAAVHFNNETYLDALLKGRGRIAEYIKSLHQLNTAKSVVGKITISFGDKPPATLKRSGIGYYEGEFIVRDNRDVKIGGDKSFEGVCKLVFAEDEDSGTWKLVDNPDPNQGSVLDWNK